MELAPSQTLNYKDRSGIVPKHEQIIFDRIVSQNLPSRPAIVADQSWANYYAFSQTPPSNEEVSNFLSHIPTGGRVLDAGAGSGRWSAAFKRDRPDIAIDALDYHIDSSNVLSGDWADRKIKSSFEAFEPDTEYDGIWSHSSLFYLSPEDMKNLLGKLSSALKPEGSFHFDLRDSRGKQLQSFYTMLFDQMKTVIDEVGLKIDAHSSFPYTHTENGNQIALDWHDFEVSKKA